MLLPSDFLDELEPDVRERLLDSLILDLHGADAYAGDLGLDRDRLLRQLQRGDLAVAFNPADNTFAVVDPRAPGRVESAGS